MSQTPTNFQSGDWVCFMRDARLVLAEVRYVVERSSWEREDSIVTTHGTIKPSGILECRPAPPVDTKEGC